ncbi:MAG TPA: isochorismatase family protein [Candidatus Sulfopaludibacter sp.]|jgi:nicotinamidase-related amidase|nr:isochorismatase family protein [Candidatus Sulfopaludibacter sp.]
MRWLISLALVTLLTPAELSLKLRTRIELYRGSGYWRDAAVEEPVSPGSTALILCDLWDHHWCQSAEGRVDVLARKIEPVVELARSRGILIIHAPSDTMTYYREAPQHLAILAIPKVQPPAAKVLADPPLPIDDSDGGCDLAHNKLAVNTRVWTKENAAIHIAPADLISDDGGEVYSALRSRGIRTLLVAGVHTNMCILNRPFAIRQMTKWGVHCILIRDLTDAMYNPAKRPFVSHAQGTQLMIEYIEKYWAPTVTSEELVRALKAN